MKRQSKNPGDTIKYLQEYESEELLKKLDIDTSRHAIRNKAIILLAKYCALRVSEIGLILIGDFTPQLNEIYIRRLKSSNSNTLKIVDIKVLSALKAYYDLKLKMNTSSNALFISQKGNPINRRTLDLIMKQYCKDTSISDDKKHFHVLKHTRAMELIKYHCPLQDVQWYLGHKVIANTMIYLSFTSEAKQQLFQHLEQSEGENKDGKESENFSQPRRGYL